MRTGESCDTTIPVFQLIFRLNFCKNGISKTALSLPKDRILKDMIISHSLITILIGSVLK